MCRGSPREGAAGAEQPWAGNCQTPLEPCAAAVAEAQGGSGGGCHARVLAAWWEGRLLRPGRARAQPLPLWQKAGAGLTAGGLGALVGSPADLTLIRMQADATMPVASRRNYKNVGDAMARHLALGSLCLQSLIHLSALFCALF